MLMNLQKKKHTNYKHTILIIQANIHVSAA